MNDAMKAAIYNAVTNWCGHECRTGESDRTCSQCATIADEAYDAAIAALSAAGYVIAPKGATGAMIDAGRASEFSDASMSCAVVYAAMLAASQEGKK